MKKDYAMLRDAAKLAIEAGKELYKRLPVKRQTELTAIKYQWTALARMIKDKDFEPKFIRETDFNGSTVNLIQFDVSLLNMGHFPGAMVNKVDDEYYILVNKPFLDAPEFIKHAILAHELGHIQMGHCDLNKNVLRMNNIKRMFGSEESTHRELQADRVALAAGFGDGLLEYLNALKEQGVDSKELRTRRVQLGKLDW